MADKDTKKGEDEMTVVVPPPKNKQSSTQPPNDADGDIAMGDDSKAGEAEAQVDPVAQTISGTIASRVPSFLLHAVLPLPSIVGLS